MANADCVRNLLPMQLIPWAYSFPIDPILSTQYTNFINSESETYPDSTSSSVFYISSYIGSDIQMLLCRLMVAVLETRCVGLTYFDIELDATLISDTDVMITGIEDIDRIVVFERLCEFIIVELIIYLQKFMSFCILRHVTIFIQLINSNIHFRNSGNNLSWILSLQWTLRN